MNKNVVCVFLFEALPTNQVISVSRAWLCDSETSFIQLNVRKQRNVMARLTVSTVTGLARFIYSALNRITRTTRHFRAALKISSTKTSSGKFLF